MIIVCFIGLQPTTKLGTLVNGPPLYTCQHWSINAFRKVTPFFICTSAEAAVWCLSGTRLCDKMNTGDIFRHQSGLTKDTLERADAEFMEFAVWSVLGRDEFDEGSIVVVCVVNDWQWGLPDW